MTIFTRKRNIIWATLLGLILSFIFVFGHQYENNSKAEFSSLSTWGLFFFLTIIFAVCFSVVLSIVFHTGTAVYKERSRKDCIKIYLFSFVLLGIIWSIYLLGAYPGFIAYDSIVQLEMYQNNAISDHHPVLHTLILGWLLDTGLKLTDTYVKGAFIYSFLQLLLTDFCFSYFFLWLYKKHAPKCMLAFSLLIFTIHPTIIINILSATKDSWFAPSLFLFTVLTIEMFDSKEDFWSNRPKMFLWTFSCFFTAIMRNNAIYPLVVLLAFLLILNRKYIKEYLVLLAVFLFMFTLYKGPVSNSLITEGSDKEEFYSVPIQQLMWVYTNNDDLSEADRQDIELLFSKEWDFAFEYYNPKIADAPKHAFNYDYYKNNRSKYISLYLSLGRRYFGDYINAFFMNTYCFWYPEGTQVLSYLGTSGYMICHSYPPIVDCSKIPVIYKYLSGFESANAWINSPYLRWSISMGSCFILFIFSLTVCLAKKAWKYLPAMLTILFIWATFLLGPCALVRYVSFLYYMIPLFIWIIIDSYKNKQ